MSTATVRGGGAVLAVVIVIAAIALAFSAFSVSKSLTPNTVTSTEVSTSIEVSTSTEVTTTTQVSTTTFTTSSSAPPTLTVVGYGGVPGQFDEAVVSTTLITVNSTVSQALQSLTKQAAIVRTALQALNVSTLINSGNYVVVSTITIFNGTTTVTLFEVEEPLTIVVQPGTGGNLNSEAIEVVQAVAQNTPPPSNMVTSASASTVSFQFSDQAQKKLEAQALNVAIANATVKANAEAQAMGMKVVSLQSVTELPTVTPTSQTSLLDLLLSLYSTASSTPEVAVSVQVTFVLSPG